MEISKVNTFISFFILNFILLLDNYNFIVNFSDQKPSFYIRKEDVKSYFKVGDNVRTVYGTGIIKTIREDGVHVVTLNNWKLANNASPTLYLQSIALSKEVNEFNFIKLCFALF